MSDIYEITNLDIPELSLYSKYSEVQLLRLYEPKKEGVFIAESPLVIERALQAGYEPISFLMEQKHIESEGRNLLEKYPFVPVYTAPFEILTSLTGFELTRGMLCAMKRRPLPDVNDVCQAAHRLAILENVTNPTNVGAIFRSAAALNVDGVLLTQGCSNPLYRRTLRVSMGCVFQIPWTFLPAKKERNSISYVDFLKQKGFKTAAMTLNDNSVSIENEDLMKEEKLAILLGNEGYGLSDETIVSCDYTVKIPMKNGVDSLNVAAASAVAFWQLRHIPNEKK